MENNHYYSRKQDDLASNPQQFKFVFKEHEFFFKTDSGVFSKNYIDFGSYTMLDAFIINEGKGPILDMGCGYGPIGIVIAKLYQKQVVMVDINERACALACENVKKNNVEEYARIINSNLFEELDNSLVFSQIITNPPIRAGKKVCFQIYLDAMNHLEINGELWIVIQKKQGALSHKAYLEELYGNCEIFTKSKGYYILKTKKIR